MIWYHITSYDIISYHIISLHLVVAKHASDSKDSRIDVDEISIQPLTVRPIVYRQGSEGLCYLGWAYSSALYCAMWIFLWRDVFRRRDKSCFVCFITKTTLTHFSHIPAFTVHVEALSRYMCSITPGTANVSSSYNHMRCAGFFWLRHIKGWVSNREVGELRRNRGHYDVTVMMCLFGSITCDFDIISYGIMNSPCVIFNN